MNKKSLERPKEDTALFRAEIRRQEEEELERELEEFERELEEPEWEEEELDRLENWSFAVSASLLGDFFGSFVRTFSEWENMYG